MDNDPGVGSGTGIPCGKGCEADPGRRNLSAILLFLLGSCCTPGVMELPSGATLAPLCTAGLFGVPGAAECAINVWNVHV